MCDSQVSCLVGASSTKVDLHPLQYGGTLDWVFPVAILAAVVLLACYMIGYVHGWSVESKLRDESRNREREREQEEHQKAIARAQEACERTIDSVYRQAAIYGSGEYHVNPNSGKIEFRFHKPKS